jgi:hypothetical protein
MRALTLIVPLLLATSLAQAQSNTVYQWKDANGVTQYSERPPTGRQAEMRRISHRGAVSSEMQPAAASAEPANCVAARKNLEMLAGNGPIGRDSNGDGVPDVALTAAERQSEKTMSEASVKAYCPGGA